MARPRKTIDIEEFKKLCAMQCTGEEIAAFFEINYDTLNAICKRELHEGFSDCYKKYSEIGKTSLRRMQYKLALDGNASMLVWLGKQYLGQVDKQEQAHSFPRGDFSIEVKSENNT